MIDAAARRVRDHGYSSLSMRALAADLGVAPMSIYTHVRDRDDLLDEIVDRLLLSSWEPSVAREDWVAWIRGAAERLRDLLIAQPVALETYLSHPVVSPNAIVRMEAMLEVLRSAGFSPDAAERAYATLHTYTIGFAALEASRASSARALHVSDAVGERLARFTTAEQFGEGLTILLEGLERRLE